MKILVIGADGFVGRHVLEALNVGHKIIPASRKPVAGGVFIDLLDLDSISTVLKKTMPDIVINCAGVVDNSEAANQNPVFSKNLLNQISKEASRPKRVIISGSAAVYGIVDSSNIPVPETAPLNAASGYGFSKLQEEQTALEIGQRKSINVVVARIFNPIGLGMHPRFLIPKLISQLQEYTKGQLDALEISRLDSERDYINIKDIAAGIKVLVENDPKDTVYNVGSGMSTSNLDLINIILEQSNIAKRPKIIETLKEPEPLVAIQADISRMVSEFSWRPTITLESTIKDILRGKE